MANPPAGSGWDILDQEADERRAAAEAAKRKAERPDETPPAVETESVVPASPVNESPPPPPPSSTDRGRDLSIQKRVAEVQERKTPPASSKKAAPRKKSTSQEMAPLQKSGEMVPVEEGRKEAQIKGYGDGTRRPLSVERDIPFALSENPKFKVPQESPFYSTSLMLLAGQDERGIPWLAGRGSTQEDRMRDARKRAMFFNIARNYVEGDLKVVPPAVRDEMLSEEYFGPLTEMVFKDNAWYQEQVSQMQSDVNDYVEKDPQIPALLDRLEKLVEDRKQIREDREPIEYLDGEPVYSKLPELPREGILRDHAKKAGYPDVDTYRRALALRGVNIDTVLDKMLPPQEGGKGVLGDLPETAEETMQFHEARGTDLEDPKVVEQEDLEEMANRPLSTQILEESTLSRESGMFGGGNKEIRQLVTQPGETGYYLAQELIKKHGTSEMMVKLNFGDPLQRGFGGYVDWQLNPDNKGSLASTWRLQNPGKVPSPEQERELRDLALKLIVASQTLGITNDPLSISADQLPTYNSKARRAGRFVGDNNFRKLALENSIPQELAIDLAYQLGYEGPIASNERDLAERVAAQFTSEELQEGLSQIAAQEMTMWQALKGTRYEVLGMNNSGDILLRQEGNLAWSLDKMDIPEATAVGLMDELAGAWTQGESIDIKRGITEGLHERKNLVDFALKYTQGQDFYTRAFWVGAGTGLSIANPLDTITLGMGTLRTGGRLTRAVSDVTGAGRQISRGISAVENAIGSDNIAKLAKLLPQSDAAIIRKAYDDVAKQLDEAADLLAEGKTSEAQAILESAIELEKTLNQNYSPAVRALNAHDATTAGILATSTKEGKGMTSKALLANAPQDIKDELIGLHPGYRKGVLQDQMGLGLEAERARDLPSMVERLARAGDEGAQAEVKLAAVKRLLSKQADAMRRRMAPGGDTRHLSADEKKFLDNYLSEESLLAAVENPNDWFEARVEEIRKLSRLGKDAEGLSAADIAYRKSTRKKLYGIMTRNRPRKNKPGRAARVWNAVQFNPQKVFDKALIPSIRNRAKSARDLSAQVRLQGLKLYEKSPAEIRGELAKVKRYGMLSEAGKQFTTKLVAAGISGKDAGNAVHIMDALAVAAVERRQFQNIGQWYARIDIEAGKAKKFSPKGAVLLEQQGKRKVKKKAPKPSKDPTDAPDPGMAEDVYVEEVFQKGAVEFLDDGSAVIHLFENADISTVLHEVGHIVRRDLRPEDNKAIAMWAAGQSKKYAKRTLGPVDYDPVSRQFIGAPEDVRYVEEAFARGLEQYLRTGDVPNPAIRTVFSYVKEALKKIYQKVSELGVRITDDVRPVYDGLFNARRFGPGSTPVDQPIGARGPRTQFVQTLPQKGPETQLDVVNTLWSFVDSKAPPGSFGEAVRRVGNIMMHAYVGGDAIKDMAGLSPSLRRAILAGESWIHEGLGDVSRMFQEEPESLENLAAWFGGEEGLRFRRGRSLATDGYDYISMVSSHMRRLFDKLSPEERSILDRMAVMTRELELPDGSTKTVFSVDETKFLTKDKDGITEAAKVAEVIRGFYTKQLRNVEAVRASSPELANELLHTPAMGTDILGALGRNISADMQIDPALANLFMVFYRSTGLHKSDKPIEGIEGATDIISQIRDLKLANVDSGDAGAIARANRQAANRVISVLAGHALGISVREGVWSDMGLYFPETLANAYKQAVNGEIPADKLLAGPVREMMRELGMEARLMPDDLMAVGENALYLPLSARKRMYRAMNRAMMEFDPVLGGLRGETAGWLQRANMSAFNSFLLRSRVRGAFSPRPEYNLMNAHDAGYQMYNEMGFRRGLAAEAAVNWQTILTSRGVGVALTALEGAINVAGAAFGVKPQERYLIQRLREALQEGGDSAAMAINRFTRTAILDEGLRTNKVLQGSDELVPGYDVSYKEMKQIFIQERLKTGFSAATISQNLMRAVVSEYDGFFRKQGYRAGYAIRELTRVVDDFAEGFDEMARISCALRIMETTGMSPRAAARVANELVMYDFSANAAGFDRHPLVKFFFPFQMFNKNVRMSFINGVGRPRFRRRMLKLMRAQDRIPEALTELQYDFSGVSALGFDPSMMTEEELDLHEQLIAALEDEYGNAWKAPDDLKARLRYELLRKSVRLEGMAAFKPGDLDDGGAFSERFQAMMQGGGGNSYDFAQSYRPRPDKRPSRYYERDRVGFPVIPAAAEDPEMQAYFASMTEEAMYPYIHIPEPAIYSGYRHVYGLLGVKYVALAGATEYGRSFLSEDNPYYHPGPGFTAGGEIGAPFTERLMNQSLQVMDPLRDPMYSNLLVNFAPDAGTPVRVHPEIARLVEQDYGVDLVASSPADDWARVAVAVGSLGATEGARMSDTVLYRREALKYRGDKYTYEGTEVAPPAFWLPPGMWAFHFRASPLYEVNKLMLDYDRAVDLAEKEDIKMKMAAVFLMSGYRIGDTHAPKGATSDAADSAMRKLDFLRKEGETPETGK